MKVIELENVSVRFFLFKERIYSAKEYFIKLLKRQLRYEELWALKNVSLEIEKGEYVGLIGRNGAGKTTLLKVIAGILRPTAGRVKVKGRIVPLMELGAGFDPELTGRENIYLNGSIMGLTRSQMDEKVQGIIEFSELKDFIDVPVKNYSTGMFTRLAFALAIDVEPDVLLIDEVLAVGDVGFQKKCQAKLEEFHSRGVTMVLVSHSMEEIRRLCHRVIWLEGGEIKMDGSPDEVIPSYIEYVEFSGMQDVKGASR